MKIPFIKILERRKRRKKISNVVESVLNFLEYMSTPNHDSYGAIEEYYLKSVRQKRDDIRLLLRRGGITSDRQDDLKRSLVLLNNLESCILATPYELPPKEDNI